MTAHPLIEFVRESNRIEGIYREPSDLEIDAYDKIMGCYPAIGVPQLEAFVSAIQPDAILRRLPSLNVRVGNHIPPQGGPEVEFSLKILLDSALTDDPYTVHQIYEHLHPFMDGNGRSGRALWLWMMARNGRWDTALEIGFLHNWYYQSLNGYRAVPR